MRVQILLLVVCVGVAVGDQTPYAYSAPESYEESAEAKYDFDWAVNDAYSGNDFGQQESRDGDNTQGSYYVQLPDGRRQTVTYYVDGDSGFVADVKYSGEAQYPESVESYEAPQRYAPPRPTYGQPSRNLNDRTICYVGRRWEGKGAEKEGLEMEMEEEEGRERRREGRERRREGRVRKLEMNEEGEEMVMERWEGRGEEKEGGEMGMGRERRREERLKR
ncbi:hypothetical protein Pcinc_018707 [Petrolisthes cinctipes]|uniref:Pro-resilin n=1 Tax=Petrolisthes cinctipes TaxID=88211 RepID=A0AAE1KIQ2_PETCI|nr:hypothetical protein Pcinc_018707 [Petrolisthes cinctipes]